MLQEKLMSREQQAGLLEAIHRIVGYLWDDEQDDYDDMNPADREGHIFEALQLVQDYLDNVSTLNEIAVG